MSHQYFAWFFVMDKPSSNEVQNIGDIVSDIARNQASWEDHHYCEFSARHGWHIYLLMAVAAAYEINGLEFMFAEGHKMTEFMSVFLDKPELFKVQDALSQIIGLVQETMPSLRQYDGSTVDQFWRPASYKDDFQAAKPYVGKLWFEGGGMNDIRYWATFLKSFHSAVKKAVSENKLLCYLVAPHPLQLYPSQSG